MDTEEEEVLGLKLRRPSRFNLGLHGRCQLGLGAAAKSRTVAVTEPASDSEAQPRVDKPMQKLLSNATSLPIIGYAMLKTGRSHSELGGNYLERINKDQLRRYFLKRLQRLGRTVTVEQQLE